MHCPAILTETKSLVIFLTRERYEEVPQECFKVFFFHPFEVEKSN